MPSWGEWMIVKFPIEEELKLERSVRELMAQIEDEKVSRLCGSLLKQVYFYQQLTRQATKHIAALEMEEELRRSFHRVSLWQRMWRRLAG